MAHGTAAPDPFGPFGAPRWTTTPTSRLILAAAVVLPLAANVLFWLAVSAVIAIVGHDVSWAYWAIGAALLVIAAGSLIAYGRRHTIGLEWIAGSVLLLIPATVAWGVAVFMTLVVLAGGSD